MTSSSSRIQHICTHLYDVMLWRLCYVYMYLLPAPQSGEQLTTSHYAPATTHGNVHVYAQVGQLVSTCSKADLRHRGQSCSLVIDALMWVCSTALPLVIKL